MSWLRIDDKFVGNSKISKLTDREFRIWVRTLCYCSAHDDPTVDEVTVSEVKGLRFSDISRLFSLGLLDESAQKSGAFLVHDWLEYRPKDPTGAERQARWRSERRDLPVTPTVTESSLARAFPDPTPKEQPHTHVEGQAANGNQKSLDSFVGGLYSSADRKVFEAYSRREQGELVAAWRTSTGWRYVRGTHGVCYKPDPLGSDRHEKERDAKPSPRDFLTAWTTKARERMSA